MAVGLATPNDFWRSVGKATIKMEAKDKIFFLADIISCFGRNADLQEQVTTIFPQLLDEVNERNIILFLCLFLLLDIHR